MPGRCSVSCCHHFCYHNYSKPGSRSFGSHLHWPFADTVTLGHSFPPNHKSLAWLIPGAPEVPKAFSTVLAFYPEVPPFDPIVLSPKLNVPPFDPNVNS